MRSAPGIISFDRYYKYEEINNFLDELQEKYSNNVRVKSVGKSFEGREIKTIEITNGDERKKNSVFIDAGIHSREWIAPATALYLIKELTEGDARNILNDIDVVIMPLVNCDGYEYTHTRERLWRKTRSKTSSNCYGVDGNRNFDFHWGEVGASPSSCSETYRGNVPFSELETQAMRDVVESMKTCKFYLTIHSYGNYLLYPWGWTSDLPESWKEIHEIATIGANAIRKATGTNYTIGSSTNVLYAAAGGSDDYMFAVFNVPISITMELPGGGVYGFDMPAKMIEKTVKESAEGIFAMIQAVADKYKK